MPSSVLGTEFRLTTKARDFLARMLEEIHRAQDPSARYLLIGWTSGQVADGDDFIPGPALLADGRDDFVQHFAENFYEVGADRVYIMQEGKRLQEFRDKVLDFRMNRLMLVWGEDLFI